MNKEQQKQIKKDLYKAANIIAEKKGHSICFNIADRSVNIWMDLPSAKMIDPRTGWWWGIKTMSRIPSDDKCRSARLIGIAMMLTMPEDMIDPKFK